MILHQKNHFRSNKNIGHTEKNKNKIPKWKENTWMLGHPIWYKFSMN